MKRIILFLIYISLALLVGRNLTFLPKFNFQSKISQTESLKKEVKEIVDRQKGSYSVYYVNYYSGNTFGINENQIYKAASVNKVPIIAVLYDLANQGKINLDDKISIQENDIQDYGTGILRYEKPRGVYSLRTLAKLTLEKSDNTAAHIINGKIGTNIIQDTINNWGLKQTSMESNTTSLSDIYILFAKIYKNEIANISLTKEMLDFMKDTDFEDRLPSLLPDNVSIYHKIGDTIGGVHDVGIIEKGNTAFFLGVMTSDTEDTEQKTKNAIAKIAKIVYDFEFNNK
ncbi:MAG: serine hydrolase [Candidatus Levybacteria bacterium]|nr:serine hydrolase [Candidatus Levybacteria bacterium]